MILPPFQSLLDAHAGDVHRMLVRMVGPVEADDCAQEAWLAALRAYPALRTATNLRGWLLTIAANKGLDAHRARARRAIPVATIPDRAAPAPAERDDELWDHLATLPPGQREAVTLRHALDLSYDDVAHLLDITPAAARRRVADGLANLRKELR